MKVWLGVPLNFPDIYYSFMFGRLLLCEKMEPSYIREMYDIL